MTPAMPTLESERLIIRPFVMDDLDEVYWLFDIELNASDLHSDGNQTRQERAEWLEWTVLNYTQLARLHQPPYGDRAIVLRASGMGMRIEKNPHNEPFWLQVVGVLENPS